jgi:dUTP pyrophosphatase
MTRGFEVVSKYEGQGVNLPVRTTLNAAGYDFEAAQDIVIPSALSNPFFKGLNVFALGKLKGIRDNEDLQQILKPVLVPTGIKAYMGENEYLQLVSRSSAPIKKRLMMPNAVGIVDADYYNNAGNEGEIFFQFINFGLKDVKIKKGERIGQGIFLPYLLADGDETAQKTTRGGGFGSTGE